MHCILKIEIIKSENAVSDNSKVLKNSVTSVINTYIQCKRYISSVFPYVMYTEKYI